MFREMRRAKQELSRDETLEILERGSSGVLALSGDEGYPYAVPLSYVYSEGKIFFHCALTGHKMDAIRQNEKASFCVVAQDLIIPEKYTTAYRSAIAFGRVSLVSSPEEKRRAAMLLAEKYNPGHEDGAQKEIYNGMDHMAVLRLDIAHLSGKEGLELSRRRHGTF